MTDDLRVIIAFWAVVSLGNQGRLSLYISVKTEKSPYWILLSKHTQQREICVEYFTDFSVVGLRFNNTMSRKLSRVGEDPTESTGNPAREPDDKEREGISASLNSETGRGVGEQSAPDCQTPVSRQEQNRAKGGVSSRM